MKKTVKTLLALAALAFAAGTAFAQSETSIGFTNKLYSDIVNIDTGASTATYAGVYNETVVELLSEKVDAKIDVSFGLEVFEDLWDADDDGVDETPYKFLGFDKFTFNDWYIEFRPVTMVTLGLHDAIYTAGSYLPVAGANLSNGNLGSDVVCVVRPIPGLRVAAGMDIPSYFGYKKDNPYFNIGADYTIDGLGSVGVTVRNLWDGWYRNMGFGIFARFAGIEDLYVDAGLSFDEAGIKGVNGAVFMLGAQYKLGSWTFAADAATNFRGTEYSKKTQKRNGEAAPDLYLGASVAWQVTESFGASFAATATFDYVGEDPATFTMAPRVTYDWNHNQVGAGVNMIIDDGDWDWNFPIYWKFYL